uniref:Uncharacterized protein n=1 Tax=Arundo donax TaxID=35708 RepID=A0A0A9BAP3_ARUDO
MITCQLCMHMYLNISVLHIYGFKHLW